MDGKRRIVLAAPGDRRDEDVQEIARLCAGKFDHYVCRRDDGLRGRASDEIPMMLRETLIAEGVPAEQIEIIPDETAAVQHGLASSRRDDLLLVFADAIARTWKQIQEFQSEEQGDSDPGSGPSHAVDLSDFLDTGGLKDFGMGGEMELVRDERGVRVAVVEEAD